MGKIKLKKQEEVSENLKQQFFFSSLKNWILRCNKNEVSFNQ